MRLNKDKITKKEKKEGIILSAKETIAAMLQWKALIPIGFDIIFLMMAGFISSIYFEKVSMIIEKIGTEMILNSKATAESFVSSGSLLGFLLDSGHSLNSMILMIALWMISLFIIFACIEGLSFYHSYSLSKKIDLNIFMKRFFIISIPYYLLFIIYQILGFFNFFTMTALETMKIQEITIIPTIMLNISIFIILFFAAISYSIISENKMTKTIKGTFTIAWKKRNSLLISSIIVLLIFMLLSFIHRLAPVFATYIIEVLLVIPFILFLRIYYFKLVND